MVSTYSKPSTRRAFIISGSRTRSISSVPACRQTPSSCCKLADTSWKRKATGATADALALMLAPASVLARPIEADAPRKFEYALSSVEHLRACAKPLGVTLLVENTPNDLATAEKLTELLRVLRYPDLGVCFDTGHAHLMGGVDPAFELLKDRIRSTHVHDNKGDRDSHLWPGEGSIDWNKTMDGLRSAPQVPALLLEIEGADGA